LEHLHDVLSRLEGYRSIDFDQYVANWELQQVIERSLQRAIQACIDIGARIIAQHGFRTARSYHDIFDVLVERGVIPSEMLPFMHEMVGLRNVLVHEYHRVEHSEIYRHLQESLPDLRRFAAHVVEFYAIS
jgi:uncharacterized protein YutE (UPF0331/DUF86 family)